MRSASPACPRKGMRGLFAFQAPRYIGRMSAPGTTYVVSAYELLSTGKRRWKTLLVTKDKVEAGALKDAIEADGVKAEIEVIPPARKRR